MIADPEAQAARALELLRCDRQLEDALDALRTTRSAGIQVAQPAQPAQEFHVGGVCAPPGHAGSCRRRVIEKPAADPLDNTDRTEYMKSDNRKPIMIEVRPARIPEEPGAVIPHAGICEGGAGQPASLP